MFPPPPAAVQVPVVRLAHGRDLPLPAYQTSGSSGMDLLAAVEEPFALLPGRRAALPTGLTIALPEGLEAQVRSRSGLALKHGLMVLNSPGTIDSDYRGEIKVLLINLGLEPVTIRRGERIAQLVFSPVSKAGWMEAESLPDSERGQGGFGHTGR